MNSHLRGLVSAVLTAVGISIALVGLRVELELPSAATWAVLSFALWPLSVAFGLPEPRFRRDFMYGTAWYLFILVTIGFVGLGTAPKEHQDVYVPYPMLMAPSAIAMFAFGVVSAHMSFVDHSSGGVLAGLRRLNHPRKTLIKWLLFGGFAGSIGPAVLLGWLNARQ